MSNIKLEPQLYWILHVIGNSDKPVTAKELENYFEKFKDKYKMSRNTFYLWFKKTKKNKLIKSSTDEKDNVVWTVSDEGENYYLKYKVI